MKLYGIFQDSAQEPASADCVHGQLYKTKAKCRVDMKRIALELVSSYEDESVRFEHNDPDVIDVLNGDDDVLETIRLLEFVL